MELIGHCPFLFTLELSFLKLAEFTVTKHLIIYVLVWTNSQPVFQSLMTAAEEVKPALIILFFISLVSIGLATLKPYQEEAKGNITNTLTVATFFSAITATTIQFSYMINSSHLQSSVNVLWLCSLVLSVASVLQSMLAYLWRQAM